MRSCETSIHDEGPNSAPVSSSVIAPPYDTRRPRVAGAGREEEDELAVAQLAGACGAVEREQRVDAAHVPRVVEIRGAARIDAELGEKRAMHRRLHVDAAEVPDVVEGRASAALERAARRAHEVCEAHVVEPSLHRCGVLDVEEPVAAVR